MGWLRRTTVVLVSVAGLAVPIAPLAAASQAAPAQTRQAGVLTDCSATFFDGDKRLGPEELPLVGPVGVQLVGYLRTGLETPAQFLAQYYDPAAGSWRYPPDNGYVIGPDGQPIEHQTVLYPGQNIDRYGSEYGSFLAPQGTPYAERAIPPQSLDGTPAAGCNYHTYRVLRPFTVDSGPIAAWFAQPGGGAQYQLDASLVPGAPTALNVLWLVDNGYLARG